MQYRSCDLAKSVTGLRLDPPGGARPNRRGGLAPAFGAMHADGWHSSGRSSVCVFPRPVLDPALREFNPRVAGPSSGNSCRAYDHRRAAVAQAVVGHQVFTQAGISPPEFGHAARDGLDRDRVCGRGAARGAAAGPECIGSRAFALGPGLPVRFLVHDCEGCRISMSVSLAAWRGKSVLDSQTARCMCESNVTACWPRASARTGPRVRVVQGALAQRFCRTSVAPASPWAEGEPQPAIRTGRAV